MPSARRGLEMLALGAIYVALAVPGLRINAVSGFATLVWPASGVALAALAWRGLGLWPGVALGALATNLIVGAPLVGAAGIACGNTLEAVVGAWAVARWAGLHGRLERLRQVTGLVLLGALGSTVISAVIGVASLRAAGTITSAQMGPTARAWWVGDVLGDLVVTPLLLSLTAAGQQPKRWLEGAALLVALAVLAWFVFGVALPESPFRQVYLLFPLLVWAAVRFKLRGATLATLLLSAVAVTCTVLGHGPFIHDNVATSLLYLQVFMAMTAITALFLAAAIVERDRAVNARETVMAMVSHDLKNPLNAISLHAEMLTRKLRDDPKLSRIVEQVERSADRMTLLVRDLLDAATLEAGELNIVPEKVEARALLDEAAEHMRGAATQRGLTLKTEGEGAVAVDHQRVLQVLINLVDNALKYAPEGSSVTLKAERLTSVVRVSVSDSGAGIPLDEQDQVFEPFFRGGGQKDGSGTGLGLSIAKKIIDAHGGRLWVESRPGATTFAFELPAAVV